MPEPHALGPRWPFLLLLAATACSPPDRARFGPEGSPAEPERQIVWGKDAMDRYGLQPVGPASRGPAAAAKVRFTLPEGWKELPARQFRDVNLLVAGNPEAECYLTLGVGGGVADNVNRWRQQMGQPPLSQAEIDALPRRDFLGRQAVVVEVEGTFTSRGGSPEEGHLLIGLVAEDGGRISTLKMTGPTELLRAEREAFFALADSIDAGATAASPSAAEPPPRNAPSALGKWQAPSHWQKAPDRPMREVTYKVGQQTECYVSVLGGNGGGLRPNLDRWCQQMGREPLTDEEIASLPTVAMLGSQGLMARLQGHYTGMSGEKIDDAVMLVVACFLPDRAVFVKMIGPADEVDANRDEFERFCSSLEG